MPLKPRSPVKDRRLEYVQQIDSAELAVVPPGDTVILAARVRCRDCGDVSYLPAHVRDAKGEVTTYDVNTRRCPEHRRSYETPAVTPHVLDSQRAAIYQWEKWLPAGDLDGWHAAQEAVVDGSVSIERLLETGSKGRYRPLWSADHSISFKECQAFAESVWADLMPADPEPAPVVHLARRRRVRSSANADEINLAPTMLHRMIVLHELAHVCLSRVLLHGTYAAHGPEFASLYLSLLGQWLGIPEAVGRALGEGIRPRKVKFATHDVRATLASVTESVRESGARAAALGPSSHADGQLTLSGVLR